MINKSKIKVVKKADAPVLSRKKVRQASPRAAAREMVSTVTDWVADIKVRKGAETRAAFDMLFSNNQRPNES